MKMIRTLALGLAASALAAVPAVADARGHHGPKHRSASHSHRRANHRSSSRQRCVVHPAFFVRGTLTSFTADDPSTADVNEASLTMSVVGANSHARRSGELADQDPSKPGVQVKGASYTATAASDPFVLKLSGFEPGETPDVGDQVRVLGKIALTRKRCADPGTSLADRYGAVDLKRVRVIDADGD